MVEIDARKFGMSDVAFEQVDHASGSLTQAATGSTSSRWSRSSSSCCGASRRCCRCSGRRWSRCATELPAAGHGARFRTTCFRGKGSTYAQPRAIAGFAKALEGGSIGVLNVGGHLRRRRHHRRRRDAHRPGPQVQLDRASTTRAAACCSPRSSPSLVVWIVGLAVPVTASYIICAVIAAPALIKLGVPDFAAHMFIFYYAVLSEVSPPTALSPFAAAAITGGDPYKTTMQAGSTPCRRSWCRSSSCSIPQGVGLLMKIPKDGSVWDIVLVTAKTAAGLAALAAAAQNWALRQNTHGRARAVGACGLLLVFPSLLEAMAERISGYDVPHPAPLGLAIAAALLLKQYMSLARPPAAAESDESIREKRNVSRRTLRHMRDRAWRGAAGRRGARAAEDDLDRAPAAPAASTTRSAAAWRTCCPSTCPACRRPPKSPAARSTTSS